MNNFTLKLTAAAILLGVAIWGTLGPPHVTRTGHARLVRAF
jgi:hypothetical protein